MTFTVLWTPNAEQGLAAIWLSAEDRSAVTSAADMIDSLLRVDPQTESRLLKIHQIYRACHLMALNPRAHLIRRSS
jgi:plasmid stabilization system protein ParE